MYLPAFIQVDQLSMLNLLTAIACLDRRPPRVCSSYAIRLRVKRGLLSIATQELLLALQPSPPGLDHGIATWHTSGG